MRCAEDFSLSCSDNKITIVGSLDKKIGSRLTSTDKIIRDSQQFKIRKSLVVGSGSSDDRIHRPRPRFTSPIRFDLGSDKKISATSAITTIIKSTL